MRNAFVNHDNVREVLERAAAANIALIGIGNARDDSAVVRMGCFSVTEMRRLRDRGAVGDILGSFFDANGHEVVDGIGDRVVAIGPADLRRIKCVVAVCSERDKGDASLGALRSGMLNVSSPSSPPLAPSSISRDARDSASPLRGHFVGDLSSLRYLGAGCR